MPVHALVQDLQSELVETLSFAHDDFVSDHHFVYREGQRFNKERGGETFKAPPPGTVKLALSVIGRYHNDRWLDRYDGWPVAYHGTNADLVLSIVRKGLRVRGGREASRVGERYGRGVYVSPDPCVAATFCDAPLISHKDVNASFLVVVQCRVRPGSFEETGASYSSWIVPREDDVRPCGLIFFNTRLVKCRHEKPWLSCCGAKFAPGVWKEPQGDNETKCEMDSSATIDSGLDSELLQALVSKHADQHHGLNSVRDVQKHGLKQILDGQDLVAITSQRNTSARIFTYVIGCLQRLDHKNSHCQALILVSDAARASRTQLESSYLSDRVSAKCHACRRGSLHDDMEKIRNGNHVIIGTPERIMDVTEKHGEGFSWRHLKIIVLDGVDDMVSNGLMDKICNIFECLPLNLQVCFFVAVETPGVVDLIARFTRTPLRVSCDTGIVLEADGHCRHESSQLELENPSSVTAHHVSNLEDDLRRALATETRLSVLGSGLGNEFRLSGLRQKFHKFKDWLLSLDGIELEGEHVRVRGPASSRKKRVAGAELDSCVSKKILQADVKTPSVWPGPEPAQRKMPVSSSKKMKAGIEFDSATGNKIQQADAGAAVGGRDNRSAQARPRGKHQRGVDSSPDGSDTVKDGRCKKRRTRSASKRVPAVHPRRSHSRPRQCKPSDLAESLAGKFDYVGKTITTEEVWSKLLTANACTRSDVDQRVPVNGSVGEYFREIRAPAASVDQCREIRAPAASVDQFREISESGLPCDQTGAEENCAAELEAWLRDLDNGRGWLHQYLEPLLREFGDIQQLGASVTASRAKHSAIDAIDPLVFEVLGVHTWEHKLLLAQGICATVNPYLSG